jgi:hypothetical protein
MLGKSHNKMTKLNYIFTSTIYLLINVYFLNEKLAFGSVYVICNEFRGQ